MTLKQVPAAAYNLLGQSVTAFWQWALTIWLMRLYGPAVLGHYSYVLALSAPFLLLGNFQLRNRLAAQPSLLTRFPALLRLRLSTIALALALTVGLLAREEKALLSAPWIWGVLILKGLESWSELMHGALQSQGRLVRVGQAMLGKGLWALALMGAMAVYFLPLEVFFFVLAMGFMLLSLFMEWRPLKLILPPVSEGPVMGPWKLLRQDPHLWSLGLMAWLTSLNGAWPRYFLENRFGAETLGQFAAVFGLYAGLALVQNAWLQGHLRELTDDTGSLMRKLGRQIVVFHGVAACLFVIAGAPLLKILFGRALPFGHSEALALTSLSLVTAMGTLLSYVLIARGKMSSQWKIMLGVNGVTVMASAGLIPSAPVLGALEALLLGSLSQTAGFAWLLWRKEM